MNQDPTVKRVEPFVGPIPDPVEPLEVKIIGTVKTERDWHRKFRTGSATISDARETVQVIGADPKRGAFTIVNTSSVTVILLAERSDSAGNGFPLLAGAALSMDHQDAVYAICPALGAGTQATINYATEVKGT